MSHIVDIRAPALFVCAVFARFALRTSRAGARAAALKDENRTSFGGRRGALSRQSQGAFLRGGWSGSA
jgi:hypothetical protein